ncbi:hypothetical protein PR048_005597 [Dryococelus australis]|uniref:Uncharacterized protein n=1 Tax=Dryococelus australis TaxID=614101 RepID=A0ABQ9I9K2_9NEOP|nr:hypothetical protein PR048_005597 [Dryococelus australis]
MGHPAPCIMGASGWWPVPAAAHKNMCLEIEFPSFLNNLFEDKHTDNEFELFPWAGNQPVARKAWRWVYHLTLSKPAGYLFRGFPLRETASSSYDLYGMLEDIRLQCEARGAKVTGRRVVNFPFSLKIFNNWLPCMRKLVVWSQHERERERESPKLNVWCGLLHDRIVGLVFFAENTVTSIVYLEMLEHFVLPQLQHFPGRWIGRDGPISWPPWSPNLTSLDFFMWGYVKDIVYATSVLNLQ